MIKKISPNFIIIIFLVLCALGLSLPALAQAPSAQAPAQGASDGAAPSGASSTPSDAGAEGGEAAEPLADPEPVPPKQAAGPDESAVNLLMRERANDLLGLADDANKMLEEARTLSPGYNQSLQQTDTSLGNFLRLYQISKGHPMEQDDILRQLTGLKTQLVRNMAPLEDISSTLTQRQAELASMQATAKDQPPDSTDPQVEAYNNNLSLASSHLSQVAVGIESLMGPGKTLLKRLDDSITKIQTDLPQTWKDYYFTESRVFSSKFPSVETGSDSVFKWFSQLKNRSLFIYPHSGADWVQSLISFFLTVAILGFIGWFIYRASHKLPQNWEYSIQQIIKGPWRWLTLGLGLVNASNTSLGGTYIIFAYPGILLLIWGLADLSWKLRVAAKPSLSGNISPLRRFFVPAALGVTLLYADIPAGVTSVLWFIIMVIFLLKLRAIRRKNKESAQMEHAFLLERFALGSAVYFAIISLIFAVIGYPRLAILVFMLLFALVNILILGNALMHLGNILCQYVFNEETDPIKFAILSAVVVPAAYLIALFSALPWLKAVPGSYFLIQNYLHKGYNIGAASFDLTKILFIVALFFLFRSLKNLGTTSLKLLPEKLPLEAGVIPPLQMLLTYFIWIVFALIALMLLGVNFTSFAVIAGGLSVGIGFGLQNIFSNLVSGIMLIFGRTILVGDYIEVGGIAGTVRSVSIRCTVVETSSNAAVFVPNSNIMSNQFINWTRNGRQVRKNITMNVQASSDTATVRELLLESAKGDSRIAADPAPSAVLNDFVENFLQFQLYVTVIDIDMAPSVLSDLRLKVEALFRQNGIKLTSPPMGVNLNPGQPQSAPGSQEPAPATLLEKPKDKPE
ncbi:MAG: mechanosensitive ion channel [Deltaproteobacteria bacterium]|jgi:small-conductance mechanosensitive channel|nr:mechanosensitive ion channel [Deltaproteobacteria bacterium]